MASTSREKRAADHVAPLEVTETIAIPVAAVAAGASTANNEALAVFDQAVTISEVNFIPETAQSGQDTNTRTIKVRNMGTDASGTDDVASYDQTSGNDLAAYVPEEISVTSANASIAAGEALAYRSEQTGTGVATPAGTFVIAYSVDDSY